MLSHEQFQKIIQETADKSMGVLKSKNASYNTEDPLGSFKLAARIQKTTPVSALMGMLAKHTVSIYDMAHSRNVYPEAVWDEKIGDHINYLLMLKALADDMGLIERDDNYSVIC